MIQNLPIENILFLDIETVPQIDNWNNVDSTTQYLWDKKTKSQRKEEIEASEFYEQRAGIMAEFGMIICISIGMIDNNTGKLKIKTYSGEEKDLLLSFCELFNNSRLNNVILCAHNGKEFDFPYIARRLLINGIQPPIPFQMFGKKPWEIPHIDTMELWKFGDWKSYVSLELLAHIFGIPSPKDDIDGSMVADIYYKDGDIDRIIHYCEKDVLTLANVFRRMRQEDLLKRLD
ncbi:3'-5' exonuclease [Epilithonimonas hispanica]|uniref:3'-5' exonuclease n=1 Tax=Epilithonimonas hispanica TaxID=358687 RepID=A0A3D9CY62_9FLAO|nr:3'-5' exonuclease [Epilithonimonas hispanica]REC70725.1 3'-5' exonuclease [Epilithonimonas hispanica]